MVFTMSNYCKFPYNVMLNLFQHLLFYGEVLKRVQNDGLFFLRPAAFGSFLCREQNLICGRAYAN